MFHAECREEILRKKTHAHIKLIRKASDTSIAVKKSKQFEIQKVVRRLKQTSSNATTKDETNISKLESVLVSLRAADIDRLANLAAASVGYCPNGTPTPVVVDNIELLDRKILSANCVSEQLDVMVKALKAIKTKAERQQQRIEGEHAEEEGDGKIIRKEKALVGSSHSDADEDISEISEEESEIEPDEDALQAIEKLLTVKQNGFRGQGSDGDGDSGGEEDERNPGVSSEDDSGLIENLSEQEEDMLMDTEFLSNTDQEDKGDYKKSGPGSNSNIKVKAKAKPKKPKNRLGQRARKQLAGQQQTFYGGRKPALYRKGQGDGGKDRLFRDDGSSAGFRERKEYTSRKRPAETEAQDEGPLHPSWELKKELANAQKHIQPPQGKKIVFND